MAVEPRSRWLYNGPARLPGTPNPRVHVAAPCGRTRWLIHRRFIGNQPADRASVRTVQSYIQEQRGAKCRGPGPAGMGFYTWAVLLPFP